MNLYEVVFWGSNGDGNARDTIYLVRAPDFLTAVQFIERNASPANHAGERWPKAAAVYELGVEAANPAEDETQRMLRGPYFEFAYNHGLRQWMRIWEGSGYTNEWEETNNRARQTTARRNLER